MAEAFKRLAQTQIPSSPGVLYTAAVAVVIKYMIVANPTGTDRALTLWQGGSADANSLLPTTSVVAGGRVEFDGSMALDAGQTINGSSDAATSLTISIYGAEMT